MLTELENGIVQIEPSDWRWGASIVGFIKYIEYHKETEKVEIDDEVMIFFFFFRATTIPVFGIEYA